jgi:hypothetical protein
VAFVHRRCAQSATLWQLLGLLRHGSLRRQNLHQHWPKRSVVTPTADQLRHLRRSRLPRSHDHFFMGIVPLKWRSRKQLLALHFRRRSSSYLQTKQLYSLKIHSRSIDCQRIFVESRDHEQRSYPSCIPGVQRLPLVQEWCLAQDGRRHAAGRSRDRGRGLGF